jgi:antitoxin ParD1/3/4
MACFPQIQHGGHSPLFGESMWTAWLESMILQVVFNSMRGRKTVIISLHFPITKNGKVCYYRSIGGNKIMNISLTPQLEKLVKNKVESGHYGSASEVMREALRLLAERDHRQSVRIEELRAEIKKGLDSGEPTPLNIKTIKAQGRKRLNTQKQKAHV